MNIDSDKAQAFFQLAIDESFSKASKSLGISQPALSQKIAKLEDELEVTLAIRSPKKIVITEAGLELIRYYKTKSELDESLLNSISYSTLSKGHFKIGSFSSITRSVLLKILKDFSSHPTEDIQFSIISKEMYELQDLLLTGKVDFLLTTKEIKRESVINKIIGEEETVHIKPKKNKNKNLPFLDHDEQDTTTFSFLKEQSKSFNIKRNYLGDIYAIIDGVENGLGQAVVSKHLISQNKKIEIIPHKKKVKTPVYLAYFDKVYYTPLHKNIIQVIESKVSSYL
jgi:DNA-binding transcriptional LysR family regulator